jgi:hypothetical protein
MSKPSAFRDFIAAIKRRWRSEHPFIRPLTDGRGNLPKASSFYAGVARPTGLHVFLYFQHSSKAWQVGQFTINVVLARDEGSPKRSGMGDMAEDGQLLEGPHRIGPILGRRDKWWFLKDGRPGIVTEDWRASSYADPDAVLGAAVDDVTRDVLAALRKLGVAEASVADAHHK